MQASGKSGFGSELVLLMSLALVAACSESPRAFTAQELAPGTGQTLPIPALQQTRGGRAVLVVYRLSRMHGNHCPIDLFLDGTPEGDLAVREYLFVTCSPGSHVLMMRIGSGECDARRVPWPITVEADKVYCFRTSYDLQGGLERVPETVAAREIAGCVPTASRPPG